MYAESAFGAFVSLQSASTLTAPFLPAEQTFHLLMHDQVMADPPAIRGGRIRFGTASDIDALVDWSRTERF